MPAILFVDDELSVRKILTDFFEDRYEVLGASSGQEALDILSRRTFDLVVSDICMPGMDGVELLRTIRCRYPEIKTALITANDTDQFMVLAKQDGIANIITKTTPFNFTEVEAVIDALISGEIFGLKRYMMEDAKTLAEYRITSSASARTVREDAVALLKGKFGDVGDTRLVLDEIITNAIYHAPSASDGMEKYRTYEDIVLNPDEHVLVECGYDDEKYGVSVTDLKGRLTKDLVLSKIERQLSGEGLFDCNGRGIHISRLFADRLIINIDRGKKTEVIILNFIKPVYRGFKPLYINEL